MNEWSYKEYQNLKSWETVSCKNCIFKITHRPRYRFKRNYEFSTNLWNTECENLFWMWHQILKSVLPGSTFSRRFPISWMLASRLRCSENIHQWPVSTEFNRALQKREEMCKSIYTVLITKIRKINKIYARSQSRSLIKNLTYLLTPWCRVLLEQLTWFAASQEIPRISRNPKVHYRTHKRPPPVSILRQPNPVHIPTSHLLEIRPNIIHPSMPRTPQWSLSLRFPHHDPLLHTQNTFIHS